MKFAYTRLVTDDVGKLAAFYERLLGTSAKGDKDYVELHPEGAILAIASRQAAEFMHGGTLGRQPPTVLPFLSSLPRMLTPNASALRAS